MPGYVCKDPTSQNRQHKILLVYPRVGAQAKVSMYLPLSLLYLAGYVKDFSVAVYDQRVDDEQVFEELLNQKPLCVGFSVMTGIQIKYALALASKAKALGIATVFGGVHPTILPEQTQLDPRVDFVIVGQGEQAFRQVVDKLISSEAIDPIVNVPVADLNQIDELPLDLVDIEHYVHSAAIDGRSLPYLFSRGCPYRCTFCCNPVISQCKWHRMSVDVAYEQIRAIVEKYRLDGISFLDENLTANVKALNELASKINGGFKWWAQSRMNSLLRYDLSFLRKMGLQRVSCGIESGSPKVLNLIKKEETVEEYIEANQRLAEAEIHTWYNYIVGFPEEDLDDLRKTIQLALKLLEENPYARNNTFYLLTPYPGTEIGDTYFKDKLPTTFQDWAEFGRFNFSTGWHDPDMVKLYERICFSSKFVGKKLLNSFPDHQGLQRMMNVFTDKWKEFEFESRDWEGLVDEGWGVLKDIFGKDAF